MLNSLLRLIMFIIIIFGIALFLYGTIKLSKSGYDQSNQNTVIISGVEGLEITAKNEELERTAQRYILIAIILIVISLIGLLMTLNKANRKLEEETHQEENKNLK